MRRFYIKKGDSKLEKTINKNLTLTLNSQIEFEKMI